MENTGLKRYKNVTVGGIATEEQKRGTRLILCKGIYTDESGKYFAGCQYIDQKRTKANKRITVSGKSPFWFAPID